MAEDTAATGGDPFASAKANLRDTIKWLATTFAALGAAVVAGASIAGIAHLSGWRQFVGLGAGAIGLLCVLLTIGTLLRLLTSEIFYIGDLDKDVELKMALKAHAADIVPPEYESLDAFLNERARASAQVREYAGDRQSDKYIGASRYLRSIDPILARITSLAHFERLRLNLERSRGRLFVLVIGAVVGLAIFAVMSGPEKKEEALPGTVGPVLTFNPGKDWGTVGHGFALACGEKGPFEARLVDQPQAGWIKLKMLSPESCSGAVIAAPAGILTSR